MILTKLCQIFRVYVISYTEQLYLDHFYRFTLDNFNFYM